MNEKEQPNSQNNTQEDDAALEEFLRVSGYIVVSVVALGIVISALILTGHFLNLTISDPVQFVTANLLNGLIFAAIVAQVLIYRKQWQVMERQWEETKKQISLMAISQCAYVAIGNDWKVEDAPLRNGILIVSSTLINGGQTPAFNLRRRIQVTIGKGNPPIGWGRFEWSESTTTEPILLIAKGEVNMSNSGLPVTQEILDDLVSGEQVVVIDGQCRYSDQVGDEQIYRFGLVFEWGAARAVIRYQEYERKPKQEEAKPN